MALGLAVRPQKHHHESLVGVQELAREIQAAGGIITAEDLQSAQPAVKPAITAQVCSCHPSSSSSLMFRHDSCCIKAAHKHACLCYLLVTSAQV